MNRFPDELTVDETHQMVNEGNWLEFETFDEREVAKTFKRALQNSISERETCLYTQVDAEGDEIYLRGEHPVNRTGVYLISVSDTLGQFLDRGIVECLTEEEEEKIYRLTDLGQEIAEQINLPSEEELFGVD